VKRGDIVIAAPPGAYGKPRLVVVFQADAFELLSVTVVPFTSVLTDAPLLRIPLEPDARNGLETRSQVMIDKAVTLPRAKIGQRIGRVDAATMQAVSRALVAFFGVEAATA
jgi:mRNA interferase MazF